MPSFGSFALLLALALCVYTLFSGAVSLRALAVGRQLAVPPEALRETSRRAGIASFIAVSCAAFALIWAAFTNDFQIPGYHDYDELLGREDIDLVHIATPVSEIADCAIRAARALNEATGERGYLDQALSWQVAFDRHYADAQTGAYALTALSIPR